MFPLSPLLFLLVFLLFTPLCSWRDSLPPITAVCCHCFLGCWIDDGDHHIPFADIILIGLVPGEALMQHFLENWADFHSSDMAESS